MEFAIDSNNQRVRATKELENGNFRCPICGGRMILKNKGDIRTAHFAHDACECTDNWHYDMSEWHRKMQSYFSDEYREVVCKKNGEKHIADVLKDGVVIEFQHSPLSSQEFCERNEFYQSLGYRIIWVFDVSDQYSNEQLYYMDRDDNTLMLRWKNPKQLLQSCPTISDYNKTFALYLYWIDEEGENINKVIWSSKDDDDYQDFKRIIIAPYEFQLTQDINPNDLFISKKDRLYESLKGCPKYEKKIIGEKGHRRMDYTCPRRNTFGLRVYGESGCMYCKYCAAIEETGKTLRGGKKYNIYCCYPNQVNEPDGAIYECNGVDIF